MPTKTRKSPIGYDEDIGTVSPGAEAETAFGIKAPYVPHTVYNAEYFNDPETQTHERIHQGQFAARDNSSKDKVIHAILTGLMQRPDYPYRGMKENEFDLDGQKGRNASLELPAYQFQRYFPQNQPAFNNYMNVVQSANPETAHNIQAPMPIQYQRGFINSGPQIPAPQLPSTPTESVMEMLKRMIVHK